MGDTLLESGGSRPGCSITTAGDFVHDGSSDIASNTTSITTAAAGDIPLTLCIIRTAVGIIPTVRAVIALTERIIPTTAGDATLVVGMSQKPAGVMLALVGMSSATGVALHGGTGMMLETAGVMLVSMVSMEREEIEFQEM